MMTASASSSLPVPIDGNGWPDKFPAKEHCSKCGLCETTYVSHVTEACAFLGRGMGRMHEMEQEVHGRSRHLTRTKNGNDEPHFGVLHEPVRLVLGNLQSLLSPDKNSDNSNSAQWTGCVTAIAASMLQTNMVDTVVCIATNNEGDWTQPEPILARSVKDVMRGRGVKPALAPSLKVLDAIRTDPSIRRLLFCGVGCAVQAFRAIQHELGLEEVYVLGTNCADNSPTPKAAREFIQKGMKIDNSQKVRGYEFMQDFRVHVKIDDGDGNVSYVKKPYFTLPGSIAEPSIAPSCLACFDYTNGLADVVVGYMGAPLEGEMDKSYQTLAIRNAKGESMVQAATDQNLLQLGNIAMGSGASHEKFASTTVSSDSIILALTGGDVKEEGVPQWIGEALAFILTSAGPKGLNFARYSIDYHILRNYLHVLDSWGEERIIKDSPIPTYAMNIVQQYLDSDIMFAALHDKILVQQQTSKKM